MHAPSAPEISIGMPTYNAETTVREAVGSVLDQTFANLELIICDNASTDGTWRIVEELARLDSRIVVVRRPVNIGANANYSDTFRRARGPYFKWASSNDVMDRVFLQTCVEYLEQHPDYTVACPSAWTFSGDLTNCSPYEGDNAYTDDDPVERVKQVTQRMRLNNALNGVIRTEALRKTALIEHYIGADVVLVGQLALLGKIALLDQRLFYRRMDAASATALKSWQEVVAHHYPSPSGRATLPTWRSHWGWCKTVFLLPLTVGARLRIMQWCLRRMIWQRRALGRDLVEAAWHPKAH
jgi:glycosyltransferase involved in cell wall biosynthesis